LAELQRMVYPHKWSPVSCRSSTGQGKFAGQRPTFYCCAMQPTKKTISTQNLRVQKSSSRNSGNARQLGHQRFASMSLSAWDCVSKKPDPYDHYGQFTTFASYFWYGQALLNSQFTVCSKLFKLA